METESIAGDTAEAPRKGLNYTNQVAAFDYTEGRSEFSRRIKACVSRAFDAVGATSTTQQILFWNLSITKNFGQDEIAEKPVEFISGVRSIYGEAGLVVFEYMLAREMKKEFGIDEEMSKKAKGKSLVDMLQLIASRGKI